MQKNYNPNYTNLSEFANNTNKNKIQNAKIKIQNYNLKLKINKIQTPVIASPEVSGRSNPLFYFVIADPETSGDEAISLNELCIILNF
jgi:hypothetical protein